MRIIHPTLTSFLWCANAQCTSHIKYKHMIGCFNGFLQAKSPQTNLPHKKHHISLITLQIKKPHLLSILKSTMEISAFHSLVPQWFVTSATKSCSFSLPRKNTIFYLSGTEDQVSMTVNWSPGRNSALVQANKWKYPVEHVHVGNILLQNCTWLPSVRRNWWETYNFYFYAYFDPVLDKENEMTLH